MSNPSDAFSGFTLSFDQGVAMECGVNAAIVLNHIIYWLKSNQKFKDRHPECIQEGKIWMYEKQEEMAEFFGFYSTKEVRDYIKILVDKGFLVKGNFNTNHFDKKNWYSLSDELFQKVFSKRQIRLIDTDLAVSSEETNSSLLSIEDKEKKKNACVAPEENAENIFYKGTNGQMRQITCSDIHRHFLGKHLEPDKIEAVITEFRQRKTPMTDPYKVLDFIAKDVKMPKEPMKKGSYEAIPITKPVKLRVKDL